MRGSINWQTDQLRQAISAIGESKHTDKEAARAALGDIPATSQRISDQTKIHSYGTAHDYQETWKAIGQHAREMGQKDMERITSEHVKSYLDMRRESGIALSTWRKEAAHAGKLGNAISEKTGQRVDFREAINDLRAGAKDALENPDRDRGYVDPREVIRNVNNPDSRLVATIQMEGGARCHEVTQIRADQLREGNTINLTNTKGGMPRTIEVRPDTFQRLQQTLSERGGVLRVNQSTYRNHVAEAASRAGEVNSGTHDLRYNFAQDRYQELTREGYAPEQAHYLISEEMGHHRPDITLHYLR
ncbi:putative Integrase family protein (plasmid) [Pseudodesulfovibrio profundus]|jgi:integrase|uniref:Putative Integrase family protein n=1 Tax=Pseudodesulfovibrio profundus TaxID=57320 RepID=A0A2C8FDW6_9BACT|nr:site-specific integrase [Pseudodesulfovibrio profundus]SOB62144.1 putative Integrase family protein [Pseudodesulfovibrio profundus]